MRTASQVLHKHCGGVVIVRGATDDEDFPGKEYVLLSEATAAVAEAMRAHPPKKDLSPVMGFLELLAVLVLSPITFTLAGVGAILDRIELTMERTRFGPQA